MTFRKTPPEAADRDHLQAAIASGSLPFPLDALPEEWWADAGRDAALWATPAAGSAPRDFLWHYYLRAGGRYFRFLLQPEPLPSARITLYKLKESVPAADEAVIAVLKAALISKTASGEHEAFFNF